MTSPELKLAVDGLTSDELADEELTDGDRGRFAGGVLGAGCVNGDCKSSQGYTTSKSRVFLHDPNMRPQTVFLKQLEDSWKRNLRRRIMEAILAEKPWMNHGDGFVEDKPWRRDLEENHGRGIMEEES